MEKNQATYDLWLTEFNAKEKPHKECIKYLIDVKGCRFIEARNAVYVYFRYGGSTGSFDRKRKGYWDKFLTSFRREINGLRIVLTTW
jgi:hypothetical protein